MMLDRDLIDKKEHLCSYSVLKEKKQFQDANSKISNKLKFATLRLPNLFAFQGGSLFGYNLITYQIWSRLTDKQLRFGIQIKRRKYFKAHSTKLHGPIKDWFLRRTVFRSLNLNSINQWRSICKKPEKKQKYGQANKKITIKTRSSQRTQTPPRLAPMTCDVDLMLRIDKFCNHSFL